MYYNQIVVNSQNITANKKENPAVDNDLNTIENTLLELVK